MSAASFLSDVESMGLQSTVSYAKTRLSAAKQLAKDVHNEAESTDFLHNQAVQARKRQGEA